MVLIDCVTLWLTNFFFNNESDVDKSLEMAKAEFDALDKEVADAASFVDYLAEESKDAESGSFKDPAKNFSVEIDN